MTNSNVTVDLNKKLFALQNEVGIISKDSTNPFFKNKYVSNDSLIIQLIPFLQKHRLLLIQPCLGGFVETRIICIDTNDHVTSDLKLPKLTDPQKIGSCITYYRRYTLLSLLGLPAEESTDDDANFASGKKPLLLNNTPEYARVVDYIANNKEADIVKIKIKYDLNNKMEQQLIKLININNQK